MRIVLLNNIPKVGLRYEVKNVADGYAMNSLIPRGLAKPATQSALKEIENMKATDEARRKVRDDLLLKNIKDVGDTTITISGKASDKGHLFAGIHTEELVSAIKEQTGLGLDVDHIVLKEPLKELGDHKVVAKVGDVETQFIVKIEEEK